MTPAAFPLQLYRGDTYRWAFSFWADAGRSVPVDLTGVVAAAEIRDRPGGTAVTALGCTVMGQTVIVELPAEDCQGLPEGGAWDLQLTYPDGDVATVLAGPVAVANDITGSAVPDANRAFTVVGRRAG